MMASPYIIAIMNLLNLMVICAEQATVKFGKRNGFFTLIGDAVKNRVVPGTADQLPNLNITGLPLLDEGLSAGAVVFWPAFDGSSPALSLFLFKMMGEMAAAWMLLYIETTRNGNKRIEMFFLIILATLELVVPFAMLMAVYAMVHLTTGTRASSRQLSWRDVAPSPLAVGLMPWCLAFSILIPNAWPTTPWFDVQKWIAYWQFWPLLGSLMCTLLQLLSASRLSVRYLGVDETLLRLRNTRRYPQYVMRLTYAFAFSFCAIPHTMSLGINRATVWYSYWFQPHTLEPLKLKNLFIPPLPLPWSTIKVDSLGQGNLWFAQWNLIFGSGAILLWAIILRTSLRPSLRGPAFDWAMLWLKVVTLTWFAGVAAAAVVLVWDRDEVLLAREEKRQFRRRLLVRWHEKRLGSLDRPVASDSDEDYSPSLDGRDSDEDDLSSLDHLSSLDDSSGSSELDDN